MTRQPTTAGGAHAQPTCPACRGRMWDNRATKTNPKAPDFKCRNPGCGGRIWPGQLAADPGPDDAAAPAVAAGPDAAGRDAQDALTGTPSHRARAGAVRAVVETVSAQTVRARVRSELRACYLDMTDFVLAEVRPRYEAAGVSLTDATVAAAAATLFVATCNRGAVGADRAAPLGAVRDAAPTTPPEDTAPRAAA
jgi:hypothetical protein